MKIFRNSVRRIMLKECMPFHKLVKELPTSLSQPKTDCSHPRNYFRLNAWTVFRRRTHHMARTKKMSELIRCVEHLPERLFVDTSLLLHSIMRPKTDQQARQGISLSPGI